MDVDSSRRNHIKIGYFIIKILLSYSTKFVTCPKIAWPMTIRILLASYFALGGFLTGKASLCLADALLN